MGKSNVAEVCNGTERGAYNWRRYLNHSYRYDKNQVIAMADEQNDWEKICNKHSYISFPSNDPINQEKLINYLRDYFDNWILGNFIRYTILFNSKTKFGKSSLSIGFCDMPFETLLETTENLCSELGLKDALAKECSSHRVIFVTHENEGTKGGQICSAILLF